MRGASMGRPSSTMPTRPFSTVPVWVRSFPPMCSTTFSPGRTVFTRRSRQTKGSFRQVSATNRKNHRANIRRSNRDIPVHPSGTGMIPGISPTTRTTPPKTWRTLSACSHPCRAAHPATSPHHRSGKRRKGLFGGMAAPQGTQQTSFRILDRFCTGQVLGACRQ